MELSFSMYINHLITSGNFAKYDDEIKGKGNFFRISVKDISQSYQKLKLLDIKPLMNQLSKRIIIINDPMPIDSDYNNYFIAIKGNILELFDILPYVYKSNITCKYCKDAWIKENNIPILNPDYSDELCSKTICASYQTRKQNIDIEYSYVDCFKMTIQSDGKKLSGFVKNDPKFGFMELFEKIKLGFMNGSDFLFYGFLKIEKIESVFQYYFEVFDVDLLIDGDRQVKLIPFILNSIPTQEKQMIMSVFFSNFDFMSRYLDFTSYKLREKYPDLIVSRRNGDFMIEFEYDVANFYKHKHQEQQNEAKADLIIAWKNTSKRNDFPYLLLPDLVGKFVPERKFYQYGNTFNLFGKIFDIIKLCFPHRTLQSLYPLIFPIIVTTRQSSTFYPIQKITFHIQNFSAEDEKSLDQLKKLFSIEQDKIIISKQERTEISISMSFETDENKLVNATSLESLDDAQKYISMLRITSPILPRLPIESELYNFVYSKMNNIEKMNVLLELLSILGNFVGTDTIDQTLYESFTNIFSGDFFDTITIV